MNPDVILLVREGYNANELRDAFGLTRQMAAHLYSVAWRTVRKQDLQRISGYTDAKRARDRERRRRIYAEKVAARNR